MQLIARGGEAPRRTMSDENYVRSCIVLANWRNGEREDALINSWLSILDNRITRRWNAVQEDKRDAPKALKLSTALKKVLTECVADIRAARKRFRSSVDVQLDGIKVFTDLRITADGRLVHQHRYVPQDEEAPIALLWAFLLDPDRPFARELRKCAFAECDRFFLSQRNAAGGPRRKYCCDKHTEAADQLLAKGRQERRRIITKRRERQQS